MWTLEVWQKAVDFTEKVIAAIEDMKTNRNHYRLLEQAEAAVTSIALNIAEGKGHFSKKEGICSVSLHCQRVII